MQVPLSGLTHPKLEVTVLGRAKERYYQLWRNHGPDVNWVAPQNSIENLREAVLQRVFYEKHGHDWVQPYCPKPNEIESLFVTFKQKLFEVLPPTSRKSYAEVLTAYSGRKLERYTRAMEALKFTAVTKKDSYVSAFVKYEKSKVDFVPRVISPRKPVYNLELLTYLQGAEKKIFRSINKVFGDRVVMKGLNCAERGEILYGKWCKFKEPVAVPFDHSRFDQHINESLLIWEHSIYKRCLEWCHDFGRLSVLLSYQQTNTVFGQTTNGHLRFVKTGGRCSGDVNTGLGNTLIAMALVYSYMSQFKVPYTTYGDGDDGGIMIEKVNLHLLDNFPEFCGSAGTVVKLEPPVHEFEHLEFCQSHPVMMHDGTYRMIRNPVYSCSKDIINLEPRPTDRSRSDWLHAVASSGMSMSGGVPIFQEYYTSILRSTAPGKKRVILENGLFWASQRMKDRYFEVHPQTRLSFAKAYGIEPAMQVIIENYYLNTNLLLGDETDQSCQRCW